MAFMIEIGIVNEINVHLLRELIALDGLPIELGPCEAGKETQYRKIRTWINGDDLVALRIKFWMRYDAFIVEKQEAKASMQARQLLPIERYGG